MLSKNKQKRTKQNERTYNQRLVKDYNSCTLHLGVYGIALERLARKSKLTRLLGLCYNVYVVVATIKQFNKAVAKNRSAMQETECKYLNDYGVTLYVGGCGDRGRWFRRQAHAHNSSKDELFGSICFLSPRRLYNGNGLPSNTLKHELAHMLAPDKGHNELWAAVLRALSGKVATSYYKHLK